MIDQVFISLKTEHMDTVLDMAQADRCGIELMHFMYPRHLDALYQEVEGMSQRLGAFQGTLSLHGPVFDMNPVSLDHSIAELSQKRYQQVLEVAARLRAKSVVLHSQWTPIYSVANCYEPWIEGTARFFKRLSEEFLQDPSITVMLENFLDPTPQILIDLIDAIDSPQVKACLDIGHVNLFSKLSPIDWADRLGSRLAHVHLHNNFGDTDSHLAFEEGTLDLDGFINHLALGPYRANLVIEVDNVAKIRQSLECIEPYRIRQQSQMVANTFLI